MVLLSSILGETGGVVGGGIAAPGAGSAGAPLGPPGTCEVGIAPPPLGIAAVAEPPDADPIDPDPLWPLDPSGAPGILVERETDAGPQPDLAVGPAGRDRAGRGSGRNLTSIRVVFPARIRTFRVKSLNSARWTVAV
jgi:hypothetical protein